MTTIPTRRPPRQRLRLCLAGILIVASLATTPVTGGAAQNELQAPDVTAQSVFAFNPATGEVILSQNAAARLPIGSVTKVATALVTLDHLEFSDQIVIASSDLVAPGFSSMGLQPGDSLTVEQLLTGLLVASGGDAAHALARTVGTELSGSDDPDVAVAAFVEAMNAKTGKFQLANTQFANPDGADSVDAWSSARDVAVLYAFLDANPHLAAIAGMTGYSFTSIGREQTSYSGVSTNQLVGQHGVLGAKTGSTQVAGGCLVLAFSAPGGEGKVILGILGSELAYDETWTATVDERWNDAVAVMEAIDAGWTSGASVAEEAAEPPQANTQASTTLGANSSLESHANGLGAGNTRLEPQPLALVTSAPDPTSGSDVEPLLVASVAGGVLTLAGVFSWSRIPPSRL